MRGRIIFVNPATSTGLIFGADRERYTFPTTEWTEPGLPPRNAEVSFRIRTGTALAIKYFSPDDPMDGEMEEDAVGVDPLDRFMSASPTAGRGTERPERVEPSLSRPTAAAADDGSIEEESGIVGKYTGDEPDEDESLHDFDLTDSLPKQDRPMLTALPPTGKILFSQDGVAARRPGWRNYLIGLVAALVLIFAGLVFTHLRH